MMRRLGFIHRLVGQKRGTAATEFALTAPLFFLLLMGIFDYSWQLYAKQVLQGAVAKAARDATLESNASSQTALDNRVRDAVLNVFKNATVTFSRKVYDSFDEVGNPEPFKDNNGNGRYDSSPTKECFEDINGNGVWDADRARTGNGGADDVVLYTATMKIKRVLPVWKMMGQPQESTLTASTVLRNQPFNAGSDADPVKCK
jgi:Flp pilus assembly protein TadG